jgi:CRISPR system Cascade subunit CasB
MKMEAIQTPAPPQASREEKFVASVIERCKKDKGLAARLRRADNPATEYQSWELLASYGVDLERDHERLPFATVAAHIAKAKAEANGSVSLGRAIASAYDDGNQSDQAKARLRRVLACDDLAELCRILRPLLTLIDSRVARPLDYARLLKQLRGFGFATWKADAQQMQRIKAQWAQEFYGHKAEAGEAA